MSRNENTLAADLGVNRPDIRIVVYLDTNLGRYVYVHPQALAI